MSSSVSLSASSTIIHQPAYDPEVLGGDTCDLGQFCLNPCGFVCQRLNHRLSAKKNKRNGDEDENGEAVKSSFTTTATTKQAAAARASRNMMYPTAYFVCCYGLITLVACKAFPLVDIVDGAISAHHKTVCYFLTAACLATFVKAAVTSPGHITAASLNKFDNYPADGILYATTHPICPTVGIPKLPRSKYDRYSQQHVPRFDHYCLALDQAVGEENYRYFIVFLTTHVAFCWYGTIMVCRLLWGATLVLQYGRQPMNVSAVGITSWWMIRLLARFVAMCMMDVAAVGLWLVLAAVGLMLSTFWAFHVYLISTGMTTNEYYKWEQMKLDLKLAGSHRRADVGADDDNSSSARVPTTTKYQQQPHGDNGKDEELASSANTNNGGISNITTSNSNSGGMPPNRYNLGLLQNWWEVFAPRSLRAAAGDDGRQTTSITKDGPKTD